MSTRADEVDSSQEIDWSILLNSIEEGLVVPVIGPDLVRIEEEGKSLSLDEWLVRQLEKQNFLEPGPPTPATLHDAIWRILTGDSARKRNALQIRNDLAKLMATLPDKPPLAYEQLAKIPPLSLFVTTNMDGLLESALDRVRYNGIAHTKRIYYGPKQPISKKDLLTPEIPRDGSLVFHLFGEFRVGGEGVLTEHDLLEYLLAMHTMERPERMLQVLSKSYLLFIGCGHQDWLARFFFRSAKQTNLVDKAFGMQMISDTRTSREPELRDFLRHVDTPEIQIDAQGDPAQFVNELFKRWQELHPDVQAEFKPPPDKMPDHSVFISYMREDIDAVKRLKAGLDAAGIVSWFDQERLRVGDWFTPEIQEAISRSTCFIAVISENTAAVEKSYFISEWRFAIEQAKRWARKFILPVVVSPNGYSRMLIPPDIRPNFSLSDIASVPNGETSTNPGFVQEIKRLTSAQ